MNRRRKVVVDHVGATLSLALETVPIVHTATHASRPVNEIARHPRLAYIAARMSDTAIIEGGERKPEDYA